MNLLAALFVLISPEIVDNLDYYGYPVEPPRAAEIQTGIELPAEDADLVRANVMVRDIGETNLFRNLQFAEARQRLERAKATFKTGKATRRLESAVTLIGFMEDVHTILRHNLAGYTFTRDKLKGATVTNATDEVIVSTPAVANTWPLFYRLYPANLREAMERFVLHGNVYGDPVLTDNQRVHALAGVALMMGNLFADDEQAKAFRARCVRAAARLSPYGRRLTAAIFPDVKVW